MRRPGSSLAIIAILALGIGANTAIFSVVNAVLVRPLPLGDPGKLVSVWEDNVEQGTFGDKSSPATYFAWRNEIPAFRDAAGYGGGAATLTDGAAEIVPLAVVSGNFFDVIGVPAQSGRTFRDEETWSDTAPVVMLSDALWSRRFGRDPAVIGSRIAIDEQPYEVVGIVPAGREFPERGIDLWLTFRWDRSARQKNWFRTEHFVQVVARLNDGVSLDEARAQFDAVNARLKQEAPDTNRAVRATIMPLQERLAGDARVPLQILLGSTMTLLLLACANVANLLLVRASGRTREVAVRSALGAGRGRIVRQMITESLTLAIAGGATGVALGLAGVRALIAMQPPDGWRVDDVPLDGRVLLFALGGHADDGRALRADAVAPRRGDQWDRGAPRRIAHVGWPRSSPRESRARHRRNRAGGGARDRRRTAVAELRRAAPRRSRLPDRPSADVADRAAQAVRQGRPDPGSGRPDRRARERHPRRQRDDVHEPVAAQRHVGVTR